MTEVGGLPRGVVDVWQATGASSVLQYTWDTLRNSNTQMGGSYKPRMRFDRMLLKTAEKGGGSTER